MIQGVLYGLAAGALWGMVFLAPRALPAFSPLELASCRYLSYGVVSWLMLLPLWRSMRWKLQREDWLALLRLSLIGNIVYYLLLISAVQLVGVAPTSLIIGVLPVLTTLVGSREHGALHLSALAWPLALIVAGVAAINLDVFLYAPEAADGTAGWLVKLGGLACAVGALLTWTLYAVKNARYLRQHPRFNSHEWSLLTGVSTGVLALLLAIPAALWAWLAPAGPARDWPLFWGITIAVALGASVLGTGFWNAASRRLPLTLSGQLIVFETLFALLYGFLYEGRWPRPFEGVAMVLLLGGVLWSSWLHLQPAEPLADEMPV
ncbi:MAG: DMT family transporter [Pseudogulbenkiania sp.]|nr:DMT family transporter [Pseudogulbenkiania sp.]